MACCRFSGNRFERVFLCSVSVDELRLRLAKYEDQYEDVDAKTVTTSAPMSDIKRPCVACFRLTRRCAICTASTS